MPGLKDFVTDYMAAIAPGGYLQRLGLVPLAPAQLEQARDVLTREVIMTRRIGG